jgi:hypothetical protein
MPYREDANRNRREAERCRKLAAEATDHGIRAQLLGIATTYEHIAEQIERLKLAEPTADR